MEQGSQVPQSSKSEVVNLIEAFHDLDDQEGDKGKESQEEEGEEYDGKDYFGGVGGCE